MTTAKSDAKPRRLGRGISSLLSTSAPVVVESPATFHVERSPAAAAAPTHATHGAASSPATPKPAASGTTGHRTSGTDNLSDVRHVAVDLVRPSPYQPRRDLDEAGLQGLADSIRRSGVLQPILVREVGGWFELVAGERRWRAAKLAGLMEVPALVRVLSDEAAAEQALVENIQREDLNAMDRAWALRSLCEKFQMTQADVAQRVGLDRTTVTNFLRLTELEPEIAGLIARGALSAGHGKCLLGMSSGAARSEMAKAAAEAQWSVRELERRVRHAQEPRKTPATPGEISPRSAVLADLQRQIGQQLGTKVSITSDRKGQKGRIALEFYGLDHFDALMRRLGINTHV